MRPALRKGSACHRLNPRQVNCSVTPINAEPTPTKILIPLEDGFHNALPSRISLTTPFLVTLVLDEAGRLTTGLDI